MRRDSALNEIFLPTDLPRDSILILAPTLEDIPMAERRRPPLIFLRIDGGRMCLIFSGSIFITKATFGSRMNSGSLSGISPKKKIRRGNFFKVSFKMRRLNSNSISRK